MQTKRFVVRRFLAKYSAEMGSLRRIATMLLLANLLLGTLWLTLPPTDSWAQQQTDATEIFLPIISNGILAAHNDFAPTTSTELSGGRNESQ